MSASSAASAQAAGTVERWRRAGRALDDVHREELRRLTDAEALVAAEQLLELLRHLPPRDDMTGLVEQQRVFTRLRR